MSQETAPAPAARRNAPLRSGSAGARQSPRASAVVGLAGLVLLLGVLTATVGLGEAGWVVGLGFGSALTAALVHGLARAGHESLGPADLVTFGRALLACGVTALTAESLLGHDLVLAMVVLTVPALALDAVDGLVARRTGTVTAFGGRLDGEVDAFLILVLSVAVAPSIGWWVLAAGLARYVFAAAGWVLPWMRGRLDFRYWRKVVTATVGVVLTVALADVLPRWATLTAVVVALALLAESFGRDVWSLWLHRCGPSSTRPARPARPAPPARPTVRAARFAVAALTTGLAVALVWFALVAPTRPDRLTSGAFLRLPLEAVAVTVLVLVASGWSSRSRRVVAVVVGTVLGAITLLKALDLGAVAVLDRPFNVVTDRHQLGSGVAFVRDSLGPWAARGTVIGTLLLVGAVTAFLPWAIGRLTRMLSRHRRHGSRAVAALAAVWVVCAASGVQLSPGEPVAAAETGPFVVGKVRDATAAWRDGQRFEGELAADAFRDPASGDLSALRGKDVVVVFVESYGRVAVEGSGSPPVRQLLDAGTDRLHDLGYTAVSAYLTSPTFGGSSWLAHATLQSGVHVGDQDRYDRLLASSRSTLTSAFSRAGWRTVAVLPSTRGDWAEGRAFYDLDEVYSRNDLGYAGPTFGFSAMPDQYALSAFERLELAATHRTPVMATIELTSSHGPWAPLPTTVDRAALDDGTVFHGIRADAVTAGQLWSDRDDVPAAYRTSILYSLSSVISFVEGRADDDLVVVLLGDHQPATIVSGFGGNRDVPVTVIARDRAVIEQVSGWGWQDGLGPGVQAPVWSMSAFRDRFLSAYSSPVAPTTGDRDAD